MRNSQILIIITLLFATIMPTTAHESKTNPVAGFCSIQHSQQSNNQHIVKQQPIKKFLAKRMLKNMLKESPQPSQPLGVDIVILFILALFIPPLAVYLKTNDIVKTLIDLLLCFLFWLPGIVYAMLVIFDII